MLQKVYYLLIEYTIVYFKNSNLKEVPNDIIKLIQDMIKINSEERKDLNNIIDEYEEVRKRYQNLMNGTYNRNAAIFSERTRTKEEDFFGKRSDSFNMQNNRRAKRSDSFKEGFIYVNAAEGTKVTKQKRLIEV